MYITDNLCRVYGIPIDYYPYYSPIAHNNVLANVEISFFRFKILIKHIQLNYYNFKLILITLIWLNL